MSEPVMNDGGTKAERSLSMEAAVEHVRKMLATELNDERIAQTSHSTVFRTFSKVFGRNIAVKIIDVNALPEAISQKFLPRELYITKMARHPHISKALMIKTPIPSKIIIASEYCPNGTLLNLILKEKRIPEYPHAARLFRQLTEAVHYLHQHFVVHRDIKAENVLLDANGDVKLIDFGFARFIGRQERSYSFCGTKPYSAPNVVKHQPYNAYAADWYAMGVLLYTTIIGKWPHDPACKEEHFNPIQFPKDFPSQAARDLILSLMDTREEYRSNYEGIIRSAWMKKNHADKWLFADANHIYEVI
ncbi:hypothetical protein AB6A40_002793 [Gnathostoma spinigerum]|uniref:Protein kinase domain-containing protein n=1 Tax=Gnathostoma spinigerum TaxID=75299 RepID=A0ABD6EFG0_9BILA